VPAARNECAPFRDWGERDGGVELADFPEIVVTTLTDQVALADVAIRAVVPVMRREAYGVFPT
jgi:hypothetical protein